MSFSTFAKAALAVLTLSLVAASPARAEWLRAESTHFIVYGDTSEREIRRYADKIERFDGLLRAYYPIHVDHEIPKLEIFLADGLDDLRKASPGISASIGGYYSPNNGRIYTVANTASTLGDLVVFHEYSHHFMYQMASSAYPSWFVEGFAEYYATAEITPDKVKFGAHSPGRMNSLTQGANTWAPMTDVLTWRVLASGRFRGSDYYAQAWAMTHYFMSTPERQAMLGRYLRAVASGTRSVEAMQAATGRTPEALQQDVQRYLGGPIATWTPQIQLDAGPIAVTRLSPEAADLIWLDLRLDAMSVDDPDQDAKDEAAAEDQSAAAKARRAQARQEEAEERADLIREALAGAARHPGDRMAALVEARAHRLEHNPAAGYAVLQPRVADGPDDADTLRTTAEMLLAQAEDEADPAEALALRREGRAYLARAMDIAPLDFRIYGDLNETRQHDAGYPSDNDVSTLEVAVALAPQSFEMRMRLADAYMSKGMPGQAAMMAMPVANTPHGGGWSRRGRALLASAQAAMGVAPDPEAGASASEEEGGATAPAPTDAGGPPPGRGEEPGAPAPTD